MNLQFLQQQLEDAANQALAESEQVRAIVYAAREAGYEVDAKLDISVFPAVTVEALERLYALPDRRRK